MRDNEKENNQPEAEVEPPILGCLLGSLTAYLVCHLFRQISSLSDLGDSYYRIPPMDGGKVLPEKMPHLHMRQIRHPIWVNHVHLVFASLSLFIDVLIFTSDRSNQAKVTNLTLSVVPKSSLILCINTYKPNAMPIT
ncbi:hypothetical protein FF1_014907 [Malus domestica]